MNTKKDIIVLGSLLHDIGKFMERAKISYPHEQFDNAEEQVTAFTAKQYVPVPPIQWIIDQAERLAAGIPECKESEIGGKEESLYPIVETVALEQEGSRTVRLITSRPLESKRLKGGFDTLIPHIRYYLLDKPDESVKIDAERVVVYRLNHTGFLPENMGANAFG